MDVGTVMRLAAKLLDVNKDGNLAGETMQIVTPIVTKVLPATANLMPLIETIVMPALEETLSYEEYDQINESITMIKDGLQDLEIQAMASRDAVLAMSSEELKDHAENTGLFKD
jgi:hypothetical protein